jgi:hypothetical protein
MNPMIQFKAAILTFLTALACFALSPTAQAQGCPSRCDFSFNTAEGTDALFNLAGGSNNTATGGAALEKNTTGSFNTATGSGALFSNTTGNNNTAVGVDALSNNNAANNTASGVDALFFNTTGSNNTAVGVSALFNSNADDNTAVGFQALEENKGGSNTATGFSALKNNAGDFNTADGVDSLEFNTTGLGNTAVGASALAFNTTGNDNTATGASALVINTTGSNNTANSVQALFSNTTGSNNTAEGNSALIKNTTGGNNIALGLSAGANLTTGSSNIDIGNAGVSGDTKKIRIGKQGTQVSTFIAGIFNVNEGGMIKPVYVNNNGQLGTQPPASSQRFKKEIKPMNQTSEAILGLKPVTFKYKDDDTGTPQFGLIAEEVAKANPDLVLRDENGKIYTVRYEAVNAMLLNEFLKEHQKVEEQQSTISELKATMAEQQNAFASKFAQQQRQIEALSAGLQKVSAAIELNKSAPTQVADNH